MRVDDAVRVYILAGLPRVKALAMRAGVRHLAWDVIADAEAYMRGAPTFVSPEAIAHALAEFLPPETERDEQEDERRAS